MERAIEDVGNYSRDDGVVGSLARRESIGMIRRLIEVGISVLQGEATALGNDAGAKPGEVAVDERYPITVLVCHSEVHRVAVIVGCAFMVEQLRGLVGAVELGSFGQIRLQDELLGGHFLHVGVCYPPRGIREGDSESGALLAEICKQMLQIDHVDDQDDFFLLGGSSLQSAALIGLIKERTGPSITMDELHDHSRLEDLRHLLEAPDAYTFQGTAPDNTSIWKGDVDIVDELELVPDWESPEEGRVFLTGVTGFVGVHLLHHLLHRPGVKQVACLARRKGPLSAATRVQHAMEQYDIFPETLEVSQKMVILEGDMGEDHLGLGRERFAWLTNWASVVFHLEAKVNFCESYQEHYHDNVLGTRNVLQVAALGRRKGFHYMSSIDVWGPTGGVLGTQHVTEDGSLQPHLQALRYDLGYGQSQWTAEAMVRRMQSKGLPVTIYRPGFVIGDSITSASNPNDFITRLIVGCIQMGTFPRIQEMRFEYCTVDFVVTATMHIAANNKNLGHAYHIVSPNQTRSITVDETCTLINDAGYAVRTIDYWEWVEQAVQTQRPDGPLAPVLPVLQERVMGQLSRWEAGQYSPRYDYTNSEPGPGRLSPRAVHSFHQCDSAALYWVLESQGLLQNLNLSDWPC